MIFKHIDYNVLFKLIIMSSICLIILGSSTLIVRSDDPPPMQTIESDSHTVTQSGTWTPVTTSSASGGSYIYSSGNSSDSLSLTFEGTFIEVVYVEDTTLGSFTVEIDGEAVRTVFTTSNSTNFDARATFEFLSVGTHTLRIIGIQGVVAIDAFVTVPFTNANARQILQGELANEYSSLLTENGHILTYVREINGILSLESINLTENGYSVVAHNKDSNWREAWGEPTWSSGGSIQRVAYWCQDQEDNDWYDICSLDTSVPGGGGFFNPDGGTRSQFDPAISPDGNIIAFTEDNDIRLVFINNSDIDNEHVPAINPSSPKWTTNNYIYYVTQDGIQRRGYFSGVTVPETVTSFRPGSAGNYDAFNNSIVYEEQVVVEAPLVNYYQLRQINYVGVEVDPDNAIVLTQMDNNIKYVEWSPDGSHVAFLSYNGTDNCLYTVQANIANQFPNEVACGLFNSGFDWSAGVYLDNSGPSERCTTTVKNTISGNLAIRNAPNTNALWLGSLSYNPPETLLVLGRHQTESWHFVQTISQTPIITGWSYSPNLTPANCMADVPIVNDSGVSLPPPPPLDDNICNGISIDLELNIRDYPSTSNSRIIGSFGDLGNAAYYVNVTGRYAAGTNHLWDDWYKVLYTDRRDTEPDQIHEGWVSVEYTTLFPYYLNEPCASIPEYIQNGDDFVSGLPFVIPQAESPISDAVELYSRQADLRLPVLFSDFPFRLDLLNYTNGYGLTEFAFLNPYLYEKVNHIHSGIDFFGNDSSGGFVNSVGCPSCIRLRPVCTGRVVKKEINQQTNLTGARVTVQCISGEGTLSNVYVSYSHLLNTGDGYIMFGGKEHVTVGGNYNWSASPPVQNNRSPHLHLEVVFDRDGDLNNAIRLNPLLFFTPSIASTIKDNLKPYYPLDELGEEGADLVYESDPYDTNDPLFQFNTINGVEYVDIVDTHLAFDGHLPGPDAPEDMDIGIHNIDEFSILADMRALASSPDTIEPYCQYVWGRTDHRNFLFRYQVGSEHCVVPAGIQMLQINNPEWLAGRWVLNMTDLLNTLYSHES